MARILIFLAAFVFFFVPSVSRAQDNSELQLSKINGVPVEINREAMTRMAEALENPPCDGCDRWLNSRTSVTQSVGGKAKEIHIVRFVSDGTPPTIDAMRKTMMQVWQGKIEGGSCFIEWAEFTPWSVEAIVLFDDGKESKIYTDGHHVAFQDHDGRSWFVRLLPAAQ